MVKKALSNTEPRQKRQSHRNPCAQSSSPAGHAYTLSSDLPALITGVIYFRGPGPVAFESLVGQVILYYVIRLAYLDKRLHDAIIDCAADAR